MDLTIGTFNLDNLFSRWDCQAVVPKGTTLTQTTLRSLWRPDPRSCYELTIGFL